MNIFVLSSSPIISIRILLYNSTKPQLIQNPAVMQGFISPVRRKIIQPQKIIPDLHGVLIPQFIYQLKRKRLRAFMYISILSEFFVPNNLRENHLVAVSFHHRNTVFLSMEWQFPTTDTPLFFSLFSCFPDETETSSQHIVSYNPHLAHIYLRTHLYPQLFVMHILNLSNHISFRHHTSI